MDTIPFWMATKLGWLRKMLQKDYLETKKAIISTNKHMGGTLTRIQKQKTG